METEIVMVVRVSIENLDPAADIDDAKEIIVETFNDEAVILGCEAQGVEVTKVELVPEGEHDYDD